jgi:hypothetical protein
MMLPFWMYMTASLGCPCEKTIFPLGYDITRRAAPADSKKTVASKAGRSLSNWTRRAFRFAIGNQVNYPMQRAAGCGSGSRPNTVQLRTADPVTRGYTRRMSSENIKTLVFVAWAAGVFVAAIASGITSVPNWIVVACAAIVPPVMVRQFWRAPEQTISESIRDARR